MAVNLANVPPGTGVELLKLTAGTVTLTDAATIAVDASLSSSFRVTLAGNRTLGNPTGAYDGQRFSVDLKQDATGSRTITLGSKYAVPTGMTVTLTLTAAKTDKLVFQYDGVADKFHVVEFQKGY